MCLMNNVFRKYLDKVVLVLLDAILVYSRNEEEHEENRRMVLQVLREHQLYAKLSNCGFYQRKVQYLGHSILEEGSVVHPKNIEAKMDWPTPKNVINIKSFIGLTGYYRRFIEVFSNITHPIMSLQRKNGKFVWSKKCEESFQQLRSYLPALLF